MANHKRIAQVAGSIIPIALALLIGYFLIMFSGYDANQAFMYLLKGSVESPTQIMNTLFAATPLIFTGLATAISFKAELYNMGSEGQLYLGAFFAAYLGFTLKGLPSIVHILICLLGGAVAGMFFALIPAIIRAYCDVDEMVSTLMLNYVAILFTTWLAGYPFRAPGSSNPETYKIESSAVLPRLFSNSQLHVGFLIAIFVFILVYIMMNKTVLGYQITSIGKNKDFSQFVGMNVAKKIVLIMAISGIISGLGGAVEVLGTHGKFVSGFSADYGWTGLTIALIGRFNPIGVLAASLLFGILKNGGSTMEIMTGVPRSLIEIIEGLIVIFFTIDMFSRKFAFRKIIRQKIDIHQKKKAKVKGVHNDG
ncbi:ABC transporter permease [Enterococcus hirae]|nr:ABC transporter permease [Enterococcaceae bacterium]MCI1918983.1 ABC transporter permease [Enterococcaceae bacterium]MDM8213180.1 ABC transporter permease [Enterococcus hirae]